MKLAGCEAVGYGGDCGKLEMHVLSEIGSYHSATANDAIRECGSSVAMLTYISGEVGIWVKKTPEFYMWIKVLNIERRGTGKIHQWAKLLVWPTK